MADDWDDDEDDEQQDDDDQPFSLSPDDSWDVPEIPQAWDDWWDFDWENYDGDYEEYAVSADYEG